MKLNSNLIKKSIWFYLFLSGSAFKFFFVTAGLFFLLTLFLPRPCSANLSEALIDDWFVFNAAFNSEAGHDSIAAVSCRIESLLFDITGYIEFKLPEKVMPVLPLTPIHFNLKKGASASYKLPLHFIGEVKDSPLIIDVVFDFPAAQMLKYIKKSQKYDKNSEIYTAVVDKIKNAETIFKISRKLDFMITLNEGFIRFDEGIFDDYLENGFVIKKPELLNMDIDALNSEIKRYGELIKTVRNAAELKAYLSTDMDLVSSEDRYLNLIYAAAHYYFKAGRLDRAAEYFNKITDDVILNAVNADTAEITFACITASAVISYETGQKKEALKTLKKAKELCMARNDKRVRYAHYNMANYYKLEGDFATAAACYRKALAIKQSFTACAAGLKNIGE